MSRSVTCRYHCAGCRAHFSSLNAFDAHRAGDHGTGRYCAEPLDDARFTQLTGHGVCAMYARADDNVTVWTLAEDLARARERSGGSERRVARAARVHVPSRAKVAA